MGSSGSIKGSGSVSASRSSVTLTNELALEAAQSTTLVRVSDMIGSMTKDCSAQQMPQLVRESVWFVWRRFYLARELSRLVLFADLAVADE